MDNKSIEELAELRTEQACLLADYRSQLSQNEDSLDKLRNLLRDAEEGSDQADGLQQKIKDLEQENQTIREASYQIQEVLRNINVEIQIRKSSQEDVSHNTQPESDQMYQSHPNSSSAQQSQNPERQPGEAPPRGNEEVTQVFDTKKQQSLSFSWTNGLMVVVIIGFAVAIINLYMDFDDVKASAENAETETQKLSKRVEGYCKQPRDTKGNCPKGAWVKGRFDSIQDGLRLHNRRLDFQEKRLSSVEESRKLFFETLYGKCLEWRVATNPENPTNENDPANCVSWEETGVAHNVKTLGEAHEKLAVKYTKLNNKVTDQTARINTNKKNITRYHGIVKNKSAEVRKDQYIAGCMAAGKTRSECRSAYAVMLSKTNASRVSSGSKNPSSESTVNQGAAGKPRVAVQRKSGSLNVRRNPSK